MLVETVWVILSCSSCYELYAATRLCMSYTQRLYSVWVILSYSSLYELHWIRVCTSILSYSNLYRLYPYFTQVVSKACTSTRARSTSSTSCPLWTSSRPYGPGASRRDTHPRAQPAGVVATGNAPSAGSGGSPANATRASQVGRNASVHLQRIGALAAHRCTCNASVHLQRHLWWSFCWLRNESSETRLLKSRPSKVYDSLLSINAKLLFDVLCKSGRYFF